MKRLLFFLSLFIACFSTNAQITRYVAPNLIGNGNGLSASNAADFLEDAFWQEVQDLLSSQPVTVKFLGGDYSRAYIEKSLMIVNMGNVQNNLLLEADPLNTIFNLPTGYSTKSQVIKVSNSINVTLKNFNFTGNGSVNYALNITTSPGSTTSNILIENCSWTDMRGVVYGATGATLADTHHITFKNCTFKRVGLNSGSHMIYNAYSSHHISVIDSYFEDCPGDYIRFRDKCDYAVVKGCTFVHPQNIPSIKFISMPLFNDGDPYPGNESFATNYSFTDNSFKSTYSNITAISFSNSGYSAPGYNYLLTAEEGAILSSGTNQQKKALLESNFGIFPEKVRLYNNSFSGLSNTVLLTTLANYGAESKGWTGSGVITGTINSSATPFTWETEGDQPGKWLNNGASWAYSFVGSGTLGAEFSAQTTFLTSSVSTSSNVGFLPAPSSGSVRVGRTSGAKHTLTGNKSLKISGSDTGNPAKFSAYSIPGASVVTSLAFTIQFNDSTSTRSIWTCALGNNDAPGSAKIFSGTQALSTTATSYPEVFNAFTWEIARTDPAVMSFAYRVKPEATGNASNNIINTTFFKRGGTYNMEVYCNNSSANQTYQRGGISYTIASHSYHIWANGTQFSHTNGINFPANQLESGIEINSFMVFGTNSTSTVYPNAIIGDNSSEATFSNFQLNFAQGVLPVTLTSFNGKKKNDKINLNWITSSERNNSHYDILRSASGENFNVIGKVNGIGNSDAKTYYSFIDENPLPGINYYKLRQVDKSGQSSLFNQVVAVSTDLKGNELRVALQEDRRLSTFIYAVEAGTGLIKVVDMKGHVLAQYQLQLEKGYNTSIFLLPSVPSGLYVVALQLQGEILTAKYVL